MIRIRTAVLFTLPILAQDEPPQTTGGAGMFLDAFDIYLAGGVLGRC